MTAIFIFIIIILVLILVIIGLVFFAAYKVTKKVRQVKTGVESFSQEFLGTSDIRQGLRQVEYEYAHTPKSVASATRICLPRITADFSDFHFPLYEVLKERTNKGMTDLKHLSCDET